MFGNRMKPKSDNSHDVDVCPLCNGREIEPYHTDSLREYLECKGCNLVFVPHRFWLSWEEEKGVYDLHVNDPEDSGYRHFLSRLAAPLLERLEGRGYGLDFGCGPGPTLSHLLREHNHRVELYDPFYFNDPRLLSQIYDFICATEVVEHLQDPALEFSRIFSMLKPGGWLGIMTKLVIDQAAFSTWHYIRDPTHICFFSTPTLGWIAKAYDVELVTVDKDVFLFHKKNEIL